VPAIRTLEGIEYYNCGDWVEHCTAVVEHVDGRMEMVGFHDLSSRDRAIQYHAA
jgi:UDP-2,3-diacylglucosamine pyrophosphatase LpxH